MFGLLLLFVPTALSASVHIGRELPPPLECPIRDRNNVGLDPPAITTVDGTGAPIQQCNYGPLAGGDVISCQYRLLTGGSLFHADNIDTCPLVIGDAASPARCPNVNTDGLPLENGVTSSDGSNTACVYTGTPTACIYQPETILSGSPSNCPQSRAFGSDRCPFLDNDGQVLVSGSSTGDGPGDTTSCIYFNNNGAACTYTPENLGSSSATNCPPARVPGPPTPSCFSADLKNGQLTDNSSDGGFVSCTYSDDANPCVYAPDGTFVSGDSPCPGSLTTDPGSTPTPPAAADIALGGTAAAGSSLLADDANTGSEPSSKGTYVPQPVIVALLTMNGALVLAVLALAGIWVFNRRRSGSSVLQNHGPGYATVASLPVPLTHSDEDASHDPPKWAST
ncbi:hypothetical protein DFH06DRAFT_468309 [Mycena polygramma]|nr:hypothetical protein DFH06DRAFT_468309 [Mycena polygramma]